MASHYVASVELDVPWETRKRKILANVLSHPAIDIHPIKLGKKFCYSLHPRSLNLALTAGFSVNPQQVWRNRIFVHRLRNVAFQREIVRPG